MACGYGTVGCYDYEDAASVECLCTIVTYVYVGCLPTFFRFCLISVCSYYLPKKWHTVISLYKMACKQHKMLFSFCIKNMEMYVLTVLHEPCMLPESSSMFLLLSSWQSLHF